ncbi:uncharacterized protein LOC117120598 [Anneissia japonica]|uniref:uncharacterized protein LOC117120598 n=1 Tax=Anneissia japonica TaxID=1529436 RepID=UPI001425ADD6|nr:uncharacterized protein LOC117120598 [Anneissia japonica]
MMTFHACIELLPRVLDLILNTDECFQDDTTAEKLLGWFRTSSETKEYYLKLVEQSSPVIKFISDCVNHKPVATRTAFTLKLLAILCEGAITNKFDIVNSIAFFQCSQNDGSLFNKSIKETVLDASPVIVGPPNHLLQLNLEFARGVFLWENASVRCAWFDAVSKASAISSFNVILQSVGAFNVAWNCLNDSSMFVKSAAEDFLAVASLDQFRTSHLDAPIREQVVVDTTEASVREGHSDCTKDADIACPQRKEHFSSEIFQKLLMVITVSYPEPSREIEPDGINEKFRPKSAIEIIRKMLKHDASLCLLATSQNRMVVQLCAFLTGGASNNTAFDVVDLLTELMSLSPFSERLSICEILQDVPKTLLYRQNEALSASYLASALWRLETRSAKKEEHFKFVILPIVLVIQHDNDNSEVFGPIDEVCLQVFGDACRHGKPTCLALVSLSLNSMLDYAKQMPLTHKEMEIFGAILVKLLQCLQGENATNSLTHSLIGSAKLSKKCFDVLATICKSHTLGKAIQICTKKEHRISENRNYELDDKSYDIDQAVNGTRMFRAVKELYRKKYEIPKVVDDSRKFIGNNQETARAIGKYFKSKFFNINGPIIAHLNGIINEDELRIIRFFLSQTWLNLNLRRTLDNVYFNTNTGVPQGDSLSPVLFTVYLEHALRGIRGRSNDHIPNEISYADGVDFISLNEKANVDLIGVHLILFNLKVNKDITEYTVIKRKEPVKENWRLTKKLGCLLGDKEDITRRKQLAVNAMNKKALWNRKGKIRLKTRLRLYNSLVKPVLLYNSYTLALTKDDELKQTLSIVSNSERLLD